MQKPSNSRMLFMSFLLATVLFVGCGEDSSTSSNGGPVVSTTMPAGWTLKENFPIGVGVSADYVYIAPPNAGFSAYVMFVGTPATGEDPADFIAGTIAAMNSDPDFSNIVVDSNSTLAIGGKNGYRVQVRYTKSTEDGILDLVERQILLVYKGKDCQLILTRLQSDSVGAAGFRSVEASLKLN